MAGHCCTDWPDHSTQPWLPGRYQALRSLLTLVLRHCVYVYMKKTVLCATCHLSKVSHPAEDSTKHDKSDLSEAESFIVR